jgi:hypothetical protein
MQVYKVMGYIKNKIASPSKNIDRHTPQCSPKAKLAY